VGNLYPQGVNYIKVLKENQLRNKNRTLIKKKKRKKKKGLKNATYK